MKTYKFTFKNKAVLITNIDSSSNEAINDLDYGFEQTLFDNISDSKIFTIDEIQEIAELDSVEFFKCLNEINDQNIFYCIQYDENQKTLWVHASTGETVGRFDACSGMDIHHTIKEQMCGKSQCLNCTHGQPTQKEFDEFCEHAKNHWNVEIDKSKIDLEKWSWKHMPLLKDQAIGRLDHSKTKNQ